MKQLEDDHGRGRPLLRSPRKVAGYPLDYLPPKDAEYVRDWTSLKPGQKVLFIEGDAHELRGHVDAVTDDGTFLWLHMQAGGGRRLFSRLEDGLVWRMTVDA
ncbi:MAG: hypothetical protein JWO93_1995 [Micrococcaceae bacterium]|nr:hypothetical protein [Micrococcaceae bacterium]